MTDELTGHRSPINHRICCVSNCDKLQDLKFKRSFFKFPTDPELSQKWLNAVGPTNLRAGNRKLHVCNFHFDKDSLLQKPMKILKNGEQVALPRKITRLKKGAIPSIFPAENDQEYGANLFPIKQELDIVKEELKDEPDFITVYEQKSLVIGITRFDDPSQANINTVVKKEETSTTPKHKAGPDCSSVIKNEISSPTHKIESVTNSTNTDFDQLDTQIDIKESSPPPLSLVVGNYKPEDLITDWKTKSSKLILRCSVPQYWGMTVTSTGIYFNYVGDVYKEDTFEGDQVTRTILVRFDMSVEIIVRGRTANYPIVNQITSFSDLILAMEKIVHAQMCTGRDCPDGLFVRQPKSSSTLCKLCQKERKSKLDKIRGRLQRMQNKVLKPKKILKRRRNRKYVKKRPTKDDPDPFWDDPSINISKTISDQLLEDEDMTDTNDNYHHSNDDEPSQTNVNSLEEPDKPKPPDGLLELFDFDCQNTRCVVVNKDITEEETSDLVETGINVIHMSTDPNRKKRVIYIGRDLIECIRQCPFCSITFFSVAEAEDHRLAHKKGKIKLDESIVGKDIFRCSECPAEFVVQTDFKVHAYYFHKERRPFVCTQCNRRFKGHKDLQTHAKFTMNGSPTCQLVCWKCGKDFKKSELYEEHMTISKAHSSCDIVKCKDCGESMARAILDAHQKTHLDTKNPSDEIALCPHCGKCLTNARNLQTHIRNVHTKKPGYPCADCGRIFYQRSNLVTHANTVHGEPRLICDQCPRMFKHRQYLKRHLKMQHGENNVGPKPSTYACEKCGLLFKYSFGLRLHIRNVHEGIKQYECDLCGERFARTDYLLRHKRHHDLYLQNVCQICKTSFRTPGFLSSHINGGHDENGRPLFRKTQSQRLPFGVPKKTSKQYRLTAKSMKPKACPICQKVLGNSQSLRKHYRGHLKLLQKKCHKCDSYFASDGTLARHLKRHDDPRFELRCRVCHVLHDSKEDLAEHMETRHKDNKYKCHICMEAFGRKHLLANHVHVSHPEENERRRELLSILETQEAQEVPVETYKQKRQLCRKSTFKENDIDTVMNKLILSKAERVYSDEEEEEQQWEQEDEQEDEDEPTEEEPMEEKEEEQDEEYNLFGQDYDITEEACRQLKEELENGY